MAALLFVWIYGIRVLDPAYTDWLMSGNDSTQHYLGSVAFRQSGWFFPLGMMDTINYPGKASIIFSDSTPFVALFFKLIRFAFPATWQYQGWWGLACFVLQAFFAWKILGEFTESKTAVFFGTILLTINPALVFRLFGPVFEHESLAAHWLILCSLLLLVKYPVKYHEPKAAMKLTALLGFGIPGIHLYFLPICGIIIAGYCLYDILKTGRWINAACVVAVYILSALASIALLGGLSQGSAASYGLGEYAFDLNGFFNSYGYSDFWKERAAHSEEGFAYLGIGGLGLILLAGVHLLGTGRNEKKHTDGKLAAVCAGMVIVSILCALSPAVRYASHVLFVIPLPGWMENLWSVFRSTGRLVWPAYYILLLWGIKGTLDGEGKRKAALLLCACLLIQTKEMMPLYSTRNKNNQTYTSSLSTDQWEQAAEQAGSTHLVLVGEEEPARLCFDEYELGAFAFAHRMTMNRFWMAHGLYEDHYMDSVDTGEESAIRENLYVFLQPAKAAGMENLNFYMLDDYMIGVPKTVELDSLPPADPGKAVFDGATVIRGRDVIGKRRYLYQDGISFGPYIRLKPGKYQITVEGIGLDHCRCNLNSNAQGAADGNAMQWTTELQETGRITISAELFTLIPDLELQIYNETDETVVLSAVRFQHLE